MNIDGGDGFDTVIVIGTEFGDDFVITKDGVFGAGLNVNFVNIESLEVDGGAGDDRFFVLSTGINFKTTIDGGLGTDLISVQGPTPGNGVISNDLLGHSGIITHDVEQTVAPDQYSGLKVVGISANVVDNDTPGVILLQSDGYSQVIQGAPAGQQGCDSYQVVLSRPPVARLVRRSSRRCRRRAWCCSTRATTRSRTLSNTEMLIVLGGVTDGTFTLSDGTHTTADIPYNASGDDVKNALAAAGMPGIDVTQDGPTYTLDFTGGSYTHNDVPVLTLTAHGFVGGVGTIQVTQHGGVSIAGGINLCFDSGDGACSAIPVDTQDPAGTAFYQSQTVKFAVDDNVPDIPSTGDIQHRVTVGPASPPHPTTIVGHVAIATSVDSDTTPVPPNQTDEEEDANPLGGFDEYGTVQSTEPNLFAPYLPTQSLPEGLRGEYLKITGGDLEAAGQIRLIEGSYIETVTPSADFKLTVAGSETTLLTLGSSAAAVQSALAALLGAGNVSVTKTGGSYTITLGGNLYLGWDSTFGVAGIGVDQGGPVVGGTIDDTTLKLNAPWDVTPNGPDPGQKAQFEIQLYSAVQVPNVRVKIFTQQTPAVVVDETNGSTTVSELPVSVVDPIAIANASDTIRVRLSSDPHGTKVVSLVNSNGQITFSSASPLFDAGTQTLTFNSSNWDQFQTLTVTALVDGVVENFHKADLKISAAGYIPYSTVVDVGDNNYPGVRVIESNGATTVVESPTQFGVSESGYPVSDTYTLTLTQAPTAGVVTVTATAQPTRASQTGGILSFSQQLVLCLVTSTEDCTNPTHFGVSVDVNFDASNWDLPQTVVVRAKGNDRVDGMDTHVFAQTLDQLNNIQGPLFVNGGEGADRTGLLEREPLMLPRERNLKPAMGAVVTSTEGASDGSTPATVTIDASTITGANQTNVVTLVQGSSTKAEQQQVTINAVGGHFKLTYDGVDTIPLLYNASALQVQTALEALPGLAGITITVSKNSNQFLITFHDFANVDELQAASIDLLPIVASDLVNFSIEITSGPAKNKVRIIKSVTDLGGGIWLATLDHLWFSPFNGDASTPTSASTYTLYATNPNLLVDEKTSTDIMWVYDGDNPASYNDPAYTAAHPGQDNPFAVGTLTYETSTAYDHTAAVTTPPPLDQFRIQGFGMGADRIIAEGTDGAALEPGGITFKDIEDLQMTLGAGNDKFTIDTTPPGTKLTLDTGAGDDVVYVNSISGHTAVDLGQGVDTLNVDQATQTLAQLYGLLTVSGDVPEAVVTNLVNGSPRQGTAVDPVNAEQRIDVHATGGTYTLTVSNGTSSYTTGAIGWDDSAASVQGAINTAFGVHGQVSVRKAGHSYFVTFVGATQAQPIPLIVAHDFGLTNGDNAGDTLNVYDGNASAPDAVLLTSSSLTGLDTPQTNEIQQIVVDATSGTFTISYNGGPAVSAAYNISAAALQSLLQNSTDIGVGNVAVTLMDDVYVLRFQGALSNTDVPQLVVDGSGLLKRRDPLGGCTVDASGLVQVGCGIDDPGSATSTTRVNGFAQTAPDTNSQDPFAIDDVQVLTMAATGGTYTLSLLLTNPNHTVVTAPIAWDATADVVRQALQNAIVANDPRLVFKFDVMVDRYRDGLNRFVYVIDFQGNLRQNNGGIGANFLTLGGSGLTGGAASVATRMDGLEYFGIENLNVDTGSASDILSVQGTSSGSNGFHGTAVTNVRLHNGDDKVFISSNADQDLSSWQNVDFLTGNLDDLRGALNIDLGAGRHELFMSDEASSHNDTWTITGSGSGNAIAIDRTPLAPVTYGTTPITYTFDATGGNLYDGVAYWTGSGNDTVAISQIARQAGQRTTTSLNTGLGDDTVTATLADGGDAFFVANLSGGSATGDPRQHGAGVASDNDSFDGSGSALPLVVFGGFGNDTISGGSDRDVILGDLGRVQYVDPVTGALIAQFGYGGRGDRISSQIVDPKWIYTFVPDLTVGGNDTMYGNGGEDILVGGAANDAIDGGTADDLIFGDAVQLMRRDVVPGPVNPLAISNPRFQTLIGSQLYSTADATLGQAQNDGTPRNYRDANGSDAPDWAEYVIGDPAATTPTGLYQTYAVQAANDNSFGNDYIAGGAGDDMIFGQLGNDVIQGDGSIPAAGTVLSTTALPCVGGTVGRDGWNFSQLVGACRDTSDALRINPSTDSLATDGSDYIEGGGGSDTIFGNLGQDDIIGGSSEPLHPHGHVHDGERGWRLRWQLQTARRAEPHLRRLRRQRHRAARRRSDRNEQRVPRRRHDRREQRRHRPDRRRLSYAAGRLPDVRLRHPDLRGLRRRCHDDEHIVPRAVTLLDYTPGGTDLSPAACGTGPVCAGNIGAGSGASTAGVSSVANAVASWYSGPVGPGQAAGSEVHGGQGDDTVYGGAGNDVLFGDGQNDVLIGGYGNDWISGGTGDDAVLGDDGRIFVEPHRRRPSRCYGIGDGTQAGQTQNDLISTPGTMQQAVINSTGALRYTAVLTAGQPRSDAGRRARTRTMPRPLYANDIIYGGLGNDALHGGAGDDAMSGGEALAVAYTDNYDQTGTQLNTSTIESDFFHPYNPGNVLGYSPTLTYQAQYDPNDPFRKITLTSTGALDKSAGGGQDWLLNFSSTEGPADGAAGTTGNWCGGTTYTCVATDGNDALFGDLGNDWLVGGTGRDTMYGGWGNDYLNADDNLDDERRHQHRHRHEPVVRGRRLRRRRSRRPDREHRRRPADRLDRRVQQLPDAVRAVRDGDREPHGAAAAARVPVRALGERRRRPVPRRPLRRATPTRNGEPFGELGIVLQHDAAWGDQNGKPRDPQAGNSPGVQRDVLRTAGNKPINSPDTDPPVAGAAVVASAPAAPVVEMAPFVSNGDQTLAPVVITGAIGATVAYTLTVGSKTVSGTGVIDLTGKLSVLVDVSSLPDGTVTFSAKQTLSGLMSAAGSTTAVKNTVIPGSVGLAQPGYVGIAGIKTSSIVLNGTPGFYVIWELDGPGMPLTGDGFFDATGQLAATLDFTGNTDGVYYLSAYQQDPVVGNLSPVGMSTPTETLDTAPPTGDFTPSTTLTNNPAITLSLSFADNAQGTGLYQMRVSLDSGTTWSAWQAYAASYSATLPAPDGTYNVVVQVADRAGNYVKVSHAVILDRTGPTLAPALMQPNNGTSYDVGTSITLTWTVADPNGVASSSASIEGQTISASGGTIDVDVLTAGSHTVTITAKDKAGNVTTTTITFTVHATPEGILKAIYDGYARGWVTAAFESTLVSQIQQVIKAEPNHANMKAKLQQFISTVQYPGKTNPMTPAFQALLLNWANDLLARL